MNEIIVQPQTSALVPSVQAGLATTRETASSAVAAQAQAAVQARYVMAMGRPRNLDVVRAELLKECKRSSFARVARYHKPIGKGVEGLSIRFVEAAIRCLKNVLIETFTVYDDAEKRIIRVSVTDLEANVTYPRDVTVAKTVERKSLKSGQVPIGQRVNSQGELTYTIEATDDDILNKEMALVSKAIRTCGLRIIPGDLADECERLIKETLRSEIEQDPDAEKKRIADGFSEFNIHPDVLGRFLGCELGQASPDQLITLRALYTAIRDGEVTAADLIPQATTTADGEPKKNNLADVLAKREAKIRAKMQPAMAENKPATQENQKQETAAPQNEPFTGDPSKLTPEELAETRKQEIQDQSHNHTQSRSKGRPRSPQVKGQKPENGSLFKEPLVTGVVRDDIEY